MTLATALLAPRTTVVRPVAPTRDTAVDVARAACLVIVVFLHAMMVGVSNPGGAAVFENTMMTWEWFPAASWLVQVMPLFFVLGGFSAYTDWSKRQAAGMTGGAYLLSRVHRLALPALGAVAATAVFLAAMTLAGVDPAFVAEAGFRISQPLWFLGVYLLCTTLVPAAVAMHRRAPV
ncbi:MAG: acyltransferase, partial [Microbacterium sp.]